MAIGQKMAEARIRKDITQDELGKGINYSGSTVGKYENETRNIPKHMLPILANNLDDEEFYFMTWNEAAGVVSIPYFNGDYIDQHPASMAFLVQKETAEALDLIQTVCWVKPVHTRTDVEREQMKKILFELLDAATSMINLVAVICKAYKFSMRTIFRDWRLTTKARRMER